MSAPHSGPGQPGPFPPAQRRLERSRTDRFLAGVCSGVAHYLNMDPTLVRVLWVVLTLALGGAPLIVYLVMMFVVPEDGRPVPGPSAGPDATGWPSQGGPDQPAS